MRKVYSVPSHLKGNKVYARPCEWNKSGVFVLDDNITQKDLRYLKEVIGHEIDVTEQPVVQKDVPNVEVKK